MPIVEAIRQDLQLFAAEDWPLRFTITDETNALLDLTNLVSVWLLKRTPEDTVEILRKTGASMGPGLVDVTVSTAENINLSGNFYHELQIIVGGRRRKVSYGAISVKPTAIRDTPLTVIPNTLFGMHIINPNDIATVPYANARATGQSWIHIEGDGIAFTTGTGIPGTYNFSALNDQLTAATAAGKKLMYTTEKVPTFATTLSAPITDTTGGGLSLTNGAYVLNGAYIKIDSEILKVFFGGGTNNPVAIRGQKGTTAATHLNGAKVDTGRYYDNGVNTGPPNEAGYTAFANFCAALVQLYKGRIEAYELYNEPEQTWSALQSDGTYTFVPDMVRFTNIFHDAIRKYDPAALICSPACQTVAYLDAFWAAGGTRDIDVISFHGYPLASAPLSTDLDTRKINPLKAILAKYGLSDKPIWDSEASWGPLSSMQGSAAQQAFIAEFYLFHWALGVKRFNWYSWDDTTTDGGGNPIVGFGALYDANNHVVLAGASAYTAIYNWMVGAQMLIPPVFNSDGTWTSVLIRPGGYQGMVIWRPAGNASYTPPGIYTRYKDLNGNTTALTGSPITIGTQPILLESPAN